MNPNVLLAIPLLPLAASLIAGLFGRVIGRQASAAVTILGVAPGMGGSTLLALEASGTVNRKDFNINWNRTLDSGGVVVSDEVQMLIQIEAKYAPPKPEEKS